MSEMHQELIRRMAGLEHHMETLNRSVGLLISLCQAKNVTTGPSSGDRDEATISQKREIGIFLLKRHGWTKVAQELARDGRGLPSSKDERIMAAAAWALSKHKLSYLLEKIR